MYQQVFFLEETKDAPELRLLHLLLPDSTLALRGVLPFKRLGCHVRMSRPVFPRETRAQTV